MSFSLSLRGGRGGFVRVFNVFKQTFLKMKFIPPPRGLENPCLKHHSVRCVFNQETDLFDKIAQLRTSGKDLSLPASVSALFESTIELRDLQLVTRDMLRCVPCDETKGGVDEALSIMGDALKFYLEKMHDSDSYVLAARTPVIFGHVSNRIDLIHSLQILINCIESMCDVNCTAMRRSLTSSKEIFVS